MCSYVGRNTILVMNTLFSGTIEDTIVDKIIRSEKTDEHDVFKLNFIQS